MSDSSKEEQLQNVQSDHSEVGPGRGASLLPPDRGLLSHITHTLSNISPLPSLTEQAEALAWYLYMCVQSSLMVTPPSLSLSSYVCNSLGGPVRETGNMTYDLPQSQLQKGVESNVVPLGNVTMGTYRHRALLYKVSCYL